KEWQKNLKILHFLCTNAIIFDTICSATEERQKEAIELSKECQLMVIIGGRTSSNTAKLKAVCEENCQTVLIETADELNQYDLNGYDTVGVTAGASTPACIIKEVLETMSETVKEQNIPEVEATEKSAEEASFEALLEESLSAMNSDQKVKGVVMGITPSEIQVDIGRKHAGYVPMDEYSNDPTADATKELKIGDEIDLIIMKTNDQEGTVMLSKRRFDSIGAWLKVVEAQETGEILEGVVTEVIRGGLLVTSNGARVFVPASQATVSRNVELEDLLKTKVRFKVMEINKQRRRAVGSIKTVLIEERKAASEALWANLAEEQVYTGVVKSMTAYGAFVDIGGVDGMIHISELSWKRIKHPSEIVNIGDTVEVFIKALDREKGKISLGFKKAEDNPWEILRRDYPVDTVVDAKIVGMTTFGAFAQIIPGIDGLIHISQIADRRIEKPADVLEVGEVVKAKITAIDFDKKRVSLSIRALIEPKEEVVEEAVEEAAEDTTEE
ncbi:MAG: S1 RNA-binding domain-containing protein, partial [Clostridia bacterium]|nr:S1 RNA-binding domain-containing protein [Clostridia bacterium]